MGIFDFVKETGKKLVEDVQKSILQPDVLVKELQHHGLKTDGLKISVMKERVMVTGKVESQEMKEKVILALGNVHGVAKVEDMIVVDTPQPESVFYTVKKGDSLSKISKEQYGNATDYMKIFEANKPMLKDPEKIFVGQVLRIPKL